MSNGRLLSSNSKTATSPEKNPSIQTGDLSNLSAIQAEETEKENLIQVPKMDNASTACTEAISDSDSDDENENETGTGIGTEIGTGAKAGQTSTQESSQTESVKQSIQQTPCPSLPLPPPSSLKPTVEPTIHLFPDLELYPFDQYAAMYFQRAKPKLFHSFNLHSMMTYSKRVPIHSLHCMIAEVEKTALDIELQVFQYLNMMASASTSDDDNSNGSYNDHWNSNNGNGNSGSYHTAGTTGTQMNSNEFEDSFSDSQDVEKIVFQSVNSQEIFDEIVCYTIKQSNNSPEELYLLPALQLLYYLVVQRHPSYHLLKYVLSYVQDLIQRVDEVGGTAVLIMRTLLNDQFIATSFGEYSSERYRAARHCLSIVDKYIMVGSLRDKVSVEQMIEMEKTVEILLLHGIELVPEGKYGVVVKFRKLNS